MHTQTATNYKTITNAYTNCNKLQNNNKCIHKLQQLQNKNKMRTQTATNYKTITTMKTLNTHRQPSNTSKQNAYTNCIHLYETQNANSSTCTMILIIYYGTRHKTKKQPWGEWEWRPYTVPKPVDPSTGNVSDCFLF